MRIHLAETDAEIAACFPVMVQLRPHLTADDFVPRIRRQQALGYKLAYVRDGDAVTACAGFRISECLAWGKFLYVDDLVTDEARRSGGHGKALLEWLIDRARAEGCDQLHLDSGVQRFAAHRFYLRHRMAITGHHFGLELD